LNRPRVICELSAHLAVLLRAGLRSEDDGEVSVVTLESASEIDREGPAPAFFLQLQGIAPDRRAGPCSLLPETGEDSSEGIRERLRRPPLWVSCRYAAGVRGRNREEEEEMLAAVLRILHDHPIVSAEHLPSLRGTGGPRECGPALARGGSWDAGGFPIDLRPDPENWLEVGLQRPRPLISFEVSVPIPSALTEPLSRVLQREVRIWEKG